MDGWNLVVGHRLRRRDAEDGGSPEPNSPKPNTPEQVHLPAVEAAVEPEASAFARAESLVNAFETSEAGRQAAAGAAVVSDDAPVVQLATLIMTQGIRDRASDIHIEPNADRVRIRFRIDGSLHEVLSLPEGMGPALVSRIKILAKMNIVERRRPQDGQLVTQLDGREVDVRVATSPTIWG